MTIEQVAGICHASNRALCLALGDTSQVSWEIAPEWQRTSALTVAKYHLDNPDASPSHSHEEWLKEKAAAGWKYGPDKDAGEKEHPCIVPFDQLPPEQQAKDVLFKAVVESLRSITVVNA